jgi:large subunit ribosomal protein L21
LDRVLLAGDESNIVIGNPTLKGARVIATVNRHGKGEKIIVFRYKSKIRYSNKLGHRQHFTNLTIDRIEVPDLQPSTEKGSSEAGAEIKENQDGA